MKIYVDSDTIYFLGGDSCDIGDSHTAVSVDTSSGLCTSWTANEVEDELTFADYNKVPLEWEHLREILYKYKGNT